MNNCRNILLLTVLCLFFSIQGGIAGVSTQEAARLGKDLTPFGALKAGNEDGTIPAWDGGLTKDSSGIAYKPGDFHQDPYSDDKPIFTITSQNMNKHADKLTEGQKALFEKYSDFRIVVYPTRRSHAAPDWINENTKKNATRTSLTEDNLGVVNAIGGIPFPIPKRGEEVVYNHLLRYVGSSREGDMLGGIVLPSGKYVSIGGGYIYEKYPYYEKGVSIDDYNGVLWGLLVIYQRPERRKGEFLSLIDPLNQSESSRKAWQYLPGQRRVRRAPTVAYDVPSGSDIRFYDDGNLFNGALDRYDWKLVGKKEKYIPYNNYKADLVPRDTLLTPFFPNPDVIRMERHRVWVVEATLKDGKRHAYAKRVMYFDEDSWVLLLHDAYDGKGNLWRTSFATIKTHWDLPGTIQRISFNFDLQKSEYVGVGMFNDMKEYMYVDQKEIPDDYFTAEHLRRLGRR